mgnify:CR=1 FL=1
MKKLLYTILLSLGTFLFTACTDYINVDKYFYDQVSLDSAFSKRVYVEGWLSSAYSVMDNIGEYREPFRWASDDLYHPDMKEYVEGNYSADHQLSDDDRNNSRLWKYYEGIRKASTFIDNVDRCPELTMDEKTDLKGQARFLRAYCYWALIRVYGPVPLIPTEGLDVNLSYEELSLPREPFDNVVDFIDAELAETARSLPIKRTVNNLGRPTRGAALGLRARVLLYAASPLFNGNIDLFDVKDCYGNQLVSQTYDETKWAKAAAAAKDVIELAKASNLYELYVIAPKATVLPSQRPPYNELYSDKNYPEGWADVDPLLSYKSIFDGTILGSKNPELIFTRTREGTAHINDWAYQSTPKTLRGNNRLAVTQKQVNAYAMNDGRSITEAASTNDYVTEGFTTQAYATENPFLPAKVNLMYNNREPRFYISVVYNEQYHWGKGKATNFFFNGEDGQPSHDNPSAGYLIRKHVDPTFVHSTNTGSYKSRQGILYRLAEAYLSYAESALEYSIAKGTYDADKTDIVKYIDKIRERAGIPQYAAGEKKLGIPTDPEEMRKLIRRERRVEMNCEGGLRWFDLRRWKEAENVLNGNFYGMNMLAEKGNRDEFYKRVRYQTRKFKSYWWPIPQDEIDKNPNLKQNPGY